jgi:hypothetical protein
MIMSPETAGRPPDKGPPHPLIRKEDGPRTKVDRFAVQSSGQSSLWHSHLGGGE